MIRSLFLLSCVVLALVIIFALLASCVHPESRLDREYHRSMLHGCSKSCGEMMMQSYDPTTGECRCRKEI